MVNRLTAGGDTRNERTWDGDRQPPTRRRRDHHPFRPPLEPGQFTSWAFTQRAIDSGLLPSMGSIGDCYDNAVIESFWSRMQVELLDTRWWKPGLNSPTRFRIPRDLAQSTTPTLSTRHDDTRRVRSSTTRDNGGMNPVSRLHETQGTPEPPPKPGAVHRCGWVARLSVRDVDRSQTYWVRSSEIRRVGSIEWRQLEIGDPHARKRGTTPRPSRF